MCNAFWQHALFVRGQSFSVKTFDRSRNGCQVIRLGGGGTIFVGLPGRHSLSPRVSHSRPPVFSCAHYFQAPLLPSATIFFFPHRYPAGGGYCHIWAIQVCAAVKGMVFKQFTLG